MRQLEIIFTTDKEKNFTIGYINENILYYIKKEKIKLGNKVNVFFVLDKPSNYVEIEGINTSIIDIYLPYFESNGLVAIAAQVFKAIEILSEKLTNSSDQVKLAEKKFYRDREPIMNWLKPKHLIINKLRHKVSIESQHTSNGFIFFFNIQTSKEIKRISFFKAKHNRILLRQLFNSFEIVESNVVVSDMFKEIKLIYSILGETISMEFDFKTESDKDVLKKFVEGCKYNTEREFTIKAASNYANR